MSDATLAAQSSGGTPKISKISEAIIRIAGNSQDGIQAIGGFLARLAGRSEQEVMTFMTIPSTISGGPSIFQVRIGSGEVLSAGDDADVLLAFYQHSYEEHINSLKKGGIVLYDSDHVEPKAEWQSAYHHVGIPISGNWDADVMIGALPLCLWLHVVRVIQHYSTLFEGINMFLVRVLIKRQENVGIIAGAEHLTTTDANLE